MPKGNNKNSFFRKYFWMTTFMLLLVAVGTLVFLWNFSQKPVSGTVHIVQTPMNVEAPIEFERFEGSYFSFAHSSQYALKSHVENPDAGVVLESAFFSQGDVNSKKIAITVENIKGRSITDTGNFIMRQKNHKKYTEEKFEINKIKGVSFSAVENGFLEKVFFIPRDGYLAEVAFTSPIADDDTANLEMTNVINSIQWKK